MMIEQGQEEPTGQAKITPAFNLPCDHVIHTVGPIVQGKLTKEHERLLISCYESCLRLADENEVKSIAFFVFSLYCFTVCTASSAALLFGNINTPVEIQQKAILFTSFSSAILRHDS